MANVSGLPLLVHTWQKAVEAKLGAVLVAAAENELAEVIRRAGGDAIVTPPVSCHQDRVGAALRLRDEQMQFKHVISLGADMPLIDTFAIRRCLAGLINEQIDIATLAAPITDKRDLGNVRVIKVVAGLRDEREVAYARDFRRTQPEADTPPYWQHVGVTAYKRPALDRLTLTPPSTNEQSRAIELMRALDMGLKVAAVRIDDAPIKVDSAASLEHVRQLTKAVTA